MLTLKEIVAHLKLIEDDLENYTSEELVHMVCNHVVEKNNTLPISFLSNMYYAGELPLLLLWEFLSRCYREGSNEVKEYVAKEALLILHFMAVKEMLDKAGS